MASSYPGSIIKIMVALIELVKKYDHAYYVLNVPLVPDVEYDEVYKRLQKLEIEHPELKRTDSPTQKVSHGTSTGFRTLKHGIPMLSIKTETEPSEKNIQAFLDRLFDTHVTVKALVVAEVKYDGLALNLRYEKGYLVAAITRGDGDVGEDVLDNVLKMESIPKHLELPFQIEMMEVRGEVIIHRDDFEKINAERISQGLKRYVNPRNAASGILRRMGENLEAQKALRFYAYGVGDLSETLFWHGFKYETRKYEYFDTQTAILWFLRSIGFLAWPEVVIDEGLVENPETKDLEARVLPATSVLEVFEEFKVDRAAIPFDIDGVVIKANDYTVQQKLGFVSREPRWAIALKFEAEEQVTVLKGIDVQVGRTGKLTPVARLEPVFVGGTTVTNVTLHNVFDLRSRGVRVGDRVVVRRAGDVIPEITMPLKEERQGYLPNFHMPKACPVCGGKVSREHGSREYRCLDTLGCLAQLKQALVHFASKRVMNIDGMGPAVIDLLVDLKYVKSLSDIYQLNEHALENAGLGPKQAKNLLTAIDASRVATLYRFIYGLGIRNVGENTSKNLAKKFGNINAFLKASYDDIMSIPDIGSITAWSLLTFLKEDRNIAEVTKLIVLGRISLSVDEGPTGLKFKDKQFVITGSFERHSREELKQKIETEGGKVSGKVTPKTSYLIAGAGGGGKLADATKLGIEVLSEEGFEALLNT